MGFEELVDVLLSEEKLSAKPNMRQFVLLEKLKEGRPTDLEILQEFGLRQYVLFHDRLIISTMKEFSTTLLTNNALRFIMNIDELNRTKNERR
jgi:hypothetical protein